MNEPMVKIDDLYEKTSQKGNRYFIGRLNGARLLMCSPTRTRSKKVTRIGSCTCKSAVSNRRRGSHD